MSVSYLYLAPLSLLSLASAVHSTPVQGSNAPYPVKIPIRTFTPKTTTPYVSTHMSIFNATFSVRTLA